MPNRIMVRPDGTTVRVPDADAGSLATLGYGEQTPEAGLEAGIQAGADSYYQTPFQKYMTFQEGGDSALSLGLTDLLFGNEDSRERARVNAGYRLGGEVAGTIATTLIPGEGMLRLIPGVGLTSAATEAGRVVGAGSKIIGSTVRGAIEGAGFGAGQAITTAQLDGSPLTAEAILAGMGQGALWGGGFGALGGAIESKLESRAAKKLASESAATSEELKAMEAAQAANKQYRAVQGLADDAVSKAAAAGKIEEEGFNRMASTVQDAASQLKEIKVAANSTVEVNEKSLNKLATMQNKDYSRMVENGNLHYVRAESRAATKEMSLAQLAAKEGKYEKMQGHLEKFKENLTIMQSKMGGPKIYDASKSIEEANNLIGLAKYRVESASKAAQDLASISAVQETLNSFPKNAAEFRGMTPARLEKLSAGIDALDKIKVAELDGVKQAVKDAVTQMGSGLGVTMEGTSGAQLQGLWRILKEGKTSRVKDMMEKAKEGNLLWEKYSKASEEASKVKAAAAEESAKMKSMGPMQRAFYKTTQYGVGAWTGKKLGIGYPGYMLGAGLVAGLVGIKGAILGTLSEKASKYLPKLAHGMQKYGSRVEPLAQRLDGTMENEKRSRDQLMETRIREIAEAAPTIRDTLYRSVQPLSIEHPELALTMHHLAIQRFQFLLSKMPKDPGMAYSNLKTLWKPDRVDTEKFSRYYEAYHDPVGVLVRAIERGSITPEAAEGVREMNPELWAHFRSELIMRAADPEVQKNTSYNDQVQLSLMTGVNFHASMDPRFIAATQQMFTERNKPLEMQPQTQPGNGAGRPAANSPGATSAQRISEH